MFHSFTGNSRRPRNVNLSGQKTNNPWATNGFYGPSQGAAQTVAQATADREKRKRERDELSAAKRIQRTWRGHQGRQESKKLLREDWDRLYSAANVSTSARAARALPLLLSLFNASNPGDQARLDAFIQDVNSLGMQTDGNATETPLRWGKLSPLLVAALERRPRESSARAFAFLVQNVEKDPASIYSVRDRYYRWIAKLCSNANMSKSSADEQRLLHSAVMAPLREAQAKGSISQSYEAFALCFLTTANLSFLETSPAEFAKAIDLSALSRGIIDSFTRSESVFQTSKDDLLWLLAHFISLNRAAPSSQGSLYLQALYRQLSILAADIRLRSASRDQEDEDPLEEQDNSFTATPIPDYVINQLEYLVNEDGIAELLSRFTSSVSSSSLSEDASLLAGYTLILLRCFPSHGDDIKLRLFQGDIASSGSSNSLSLPSVKFLWKAVARTEVFAAITQTNPPPRPSTIVSLLQSDTSRNQQWRTILLFLELYAFLLRVTDDEDFLPSATEIVTEQSPAVRRIRSSGLSLEELKTLISFLKNLSFPLYYNLPEIMPSSAKPSRLNSLLGVGPNPSDTREDAEKSGPTSFAGIIGLDVLTLRAASTATIRALYERDSRWSYLPKDFWLMTSKFDMDVFISAVVLEEQRKDAMEDGDDDMADEDIDVGSHHTFAGQRLSRAAQIERQRQLQRVQKEQLLASVGPKLEVLRNMPFVIPFEVRVQIFRQFVHLDKQKRRGGYVDPDRWRLSILNGQGFNPLRADPLGRHTARIKRGQVFWDAFEQFYELGEGLKEPIQITFIDQFDQPEAGIDGGGVTKEFLTSVTDEAFGVGSSDYDPNEPDTHRMFVTNSQNLIYPNPTAFDERAELSRKQGHPDGTAEFKQSEQTLAKQYEFLGRIVGKCMYEGILIDIGFAGFFLLKWASSGQSSVGDFRANLNDLRDMDPDLYKGLINLKNYTGDVSDLALDFTIADQILDQTTGEVHTITRPLRKNGENTPVTNKDRTLYISYVALYRLVAQQQRQTKAFLKGLGAIINPSWLSMFNQQELQRLVGGEDDEIDVEDLRSNTLYSGLYAIGDDGLEHPTVQMFWQVMHQLNDEERRAVLKYVTSTPRAPLLGFTQLSPQFSIRDGGDDQERLPSTSTCVNLLKLPRYKNAATLKNKLLYAVQSGAGFDLS